MCSIIILRRPSHPWPVVVGANRDEMLDRPWDAPARYCGTVFRDEYIYLDVRPAAEDDDASELTADEDDELAVQDDWPGDVVGAAALVLLAAVLAGCAVARRR